MLFFEDFICLINHQQKNQLLLIEIVYRLILDSFLILLIVEVSELLIPLCLTAN